MELVIIRHAESLHNTGATEDLDSSLSNDGFRQMKLTTRWLKNTFFKDKEIKSFIGYVSPLLRCLQTARTISHNLQIPFKVDCDLREFSVTKENTTSPSLKIKKRKESYDFQWLDNFHELEEIYFSEENLADFIPRVKQFYSKLNKENGKYIVVSHGSVCRCLHALATNNLEALVDRYSNFDFEENTSIKNCGITVINKGKEIMFSKKVY